MATRDDTKDPNKAADEAARTARTMTDQVTRVGEQTARAGADIARRAPRRPKTSWRGPEHGHPDLQRAADQFTQVLGFSSPQAQELARRSSENVQAVTQASTVLVRGFQEVSQEVFGVLQDRLTKNLEAGNRIAGARSVQDLWRFIDLARDTLQQVIETNRRIAECRCALPKRPPASSRPKQIEVRNRSAAPRNWGVGGCAGCEAIRGNLTNSRWRLGHSAASSRRGSDRSV